MGQGISNQFKEVRARGDRQDVEFFLAKKNNLSLSEFSYRKILGNGAFGSVSMYQMKNTRYLLAVKKALPDSTVEVSCEAQLMLRLDHPAIIKCFGYDSNEKILFMELAFSWLKIIEMEKFYTKEVVLQHGLNLASALCYLKQEEIMHRDIKPDNILLFHDGSVKLADFGKAVDMKKFPNGKRGRSSYNLSTHLHRAPELFDRTRKYKYEVDVYALASIFLLVLNMPKQVHFFVEEHLNRPPTIRELFTYQCEFSRSLYDAIAVDGNDRITCEDLRKLIERRLDAVRNSAV